MIQHSGENCAQSYRAFMNSEIDSMVGISLNNARRFSSYSSGFSSIYFSSEKKYISDFLFTAVPAVLSSSICEFRIVATAPM